MTDFLTAHAPLSFSLKQRRALVAILAIAVFAALLLAALGINPFRPSGADTVNETIFGSAHPAVGSSADNKPVELGTRFQVMQGGWITGIRYWKSSLNTGTHTGTLWTSMPKQLATVTFKNESASGWQVASLSKPVWVSKGHVYVVSYHTNSGHYADDPGYFTGRGAGPQHVKAFPDGTWAGRQSIYRYGTSGYPTSTWKGSNYWVDVVFKTNKAPTTQVTDPPPTQPTTPPTSPPTVPPTSPPTTPPTSPPTTSPPSDGSSCPLTIAGESCWAAHTGVPGYTEAQILSGHSPLQHVTGDMTITTAGTVVENKWIDGCIAVRASNVTIRNVLVHTQNRCHGGNQRSGGSAIDTGNDASSLSNVQVIDTEVDGMDAPTDSTGVGTVSVTCLRCNVHGAPKVIWASSGTSVIDSYLHDQNEVGATHTDVLMCDGGTGMVIQHSYIKSKPTNRYSTGAVACLADYGGVSHVTITDNFLEGGSGWDISGGGDLGTYVVATGNALSPNNGWGGTDYVKYFSLGNAGNAWSNNFNSETLAKISP